MNILGVGTAEVILVLLIMLIVAGPKRMAQWAYEGGRYMAKFRRIWAETMQMLENELNESGVDVKLPRDVPTRKQLNSQISKAFEEVSQPVQETIAEVDAQLKEVERSVDINANASTNGGRSAANLSETANPDAENYMDDRSEFGTWSGSKLED